MKKVLAYVAIAIALVCAGCIGTLSEMMTPGHADPDAVAYVQKAGVGGEEDYKNPLGYSSLADVKRLDINLKAAIALTDQELKQLAEKKKLQDQILTGTVSSDLELAEANHEFLFNAKTGLISLGMVGLGGLGMGYLGLTRKRSGDLTPEEAESDKANAVSIAVAEASSTITDLQDMLKSKTTAVTQLVSNMQTVIDGLPTKEAQDAFLKTLKETQLPETRAAVKEAKASL